MTRRSVVTGAQAEMGRESIAKQDSGLKWTLRVLTVTLALISLLTLDESLGLLISASLIVFGELILAFGFVAVLAGTALLAFPPGALARSGTAFVASAIVIALAPLFVKPDHRETKASRAIALAPVAVTPALFLSGSAGSELLVLVAFLSVPTYEFSIRQQLARRILGCISWLVVLESCSFVASLVGGGFSGAPDRVILFANGNIWNIFSPFTMTWFGTRVLGGEHSIPRIVVFTQEPGLSIFSLAIAASYFFLRKGAFNRFGFLMVIVVGVASQSFGVYLSTLGGVAAAAVVFMWRRGRRLAAIVAVAAGSASLLFIAKAAVAFRVDNSVNTVHDRGLGGGDTLAAGNVNMLVGIQHYKFETAALAVAIVLACVFLARNFSVPAVFLLAASICTAAFNEPLQWQFGIWILFALQTVAYAPDRSSSGVRDINGLEDDRLNKKTELVRPRKSSE
ncbi:hypothetical protein [Nocardioides sp. Kera G14]|uniref:hypothetical protein n=1 Tax=Nocardioides sp. Kera G14 TaxID=2884264 RepID=UPI001D1229FF|nr:hypothetical protein [Nocardioides sp. Kera G14]UDY23117.1 hypothetical protein LH076_13760 [Nocardioides sp. Kera G14]